MPEEPDLFLADRITAEYEGEEVEIWNHLTVREVHGVRAPEIVSHHEVLAGDGSTAEEPEFITPAMDDQLRSLDVYPDATVLDPRDDDVQIL